MNIRLETPADYAVVENLTREAFWNVYKPGADEHYFVHMMRSHETFIPELGKAVITRQNRESGSVRFSGGNSAVIVIEAYARTFCGNVPKYRLIAIHCSDQCV